MKASHGRRSLLLFVYSDSYYGRVRAEVKTNKMGYITVIVRVAMAGIYGNVNKPCPRTRFVYCHKSLAPVQ